MCNPTSRSVVKDAERERDQALEAVGELSAKTDALEEQLDSLGRLLKDAQERTSEKVKQLQDVEVRAQEQQTKRPTSQNDHPLYLFAKCAPHFDGSRAWLCGKSVEMCMYLREGTRPVFVADVDNYPTPSTLPCHSAHGRRL